jgi:hypothetical protein
MLQKERKMKKTLISVIIITLLLFGNITTLFADSADKKTPSESYNQGMMDAKMMNSGTGWLWGGIGSGFFFGLLGTGVVWGISAASSPEPDFIPENVEHINYMMGYEKEAKKINSRKALTGGLIGTGISAVLLITLYAVSY